MSEIPRHHQSTALNTSVTSSLRANAPVFTPSNPSASTTIDCASSAMPRRASSTSLTPRNPTSPAITNPEHNNFNNMSSNDINRPATSLSQDQFQNKGSVPRGTTFHAGNRSDSHNPYSHKDSNNSAKWLAKEGYRMRQHRAHRIFAAKKRQDNTADHQQSSSSATHSSFPYEDSPADTTCSSSSSSNAPNNSASMSSLTPALQRTNSVPSSSNSFRNFSSHGDQSTNRYSISSSSNTPNPNPNNSNNNCSGNGNGHFRNRRGQNNSTSRNRKRHNSGVQQYYNEENQSVRDNFAGSENASNYSAFDIHRRRSGLSRNRDYSAGNSRYSNDPPILTRDRTVDPGDNSSPPLSLARIVHQNEAQSDQADETEKMHNVDSHDDKSSSAIPQTPVTGRNVEHESNISCVTRQDGSPDRESSPSNNAGDSLSPAMSLMSGPSSAPDSPEPREGVKQNLEAAADDKAERTHRIPENIQDTSNHRDHKSSIASDKIQNDSPQTAAAAAAVRAAKAAAVAEAAAAEARLAEAKAAAARSTALDMPESGKWCQDCAGLGLHIAALVCQLQKSKSQNNDTDAEHEKEREKEREKEKKPSWKRTVSAAMLGASSSGSSNSEVTKIKAEKTRLEEENEVLRATVEFLYEKVDHLTTSRACRA